PGQRGEVAIRGETVVDGYESNPAANAAAFTAGWFRTGDEGMLDPDGYLFLTGRLKEQINRGGEKISPIEVDDVLLRHPAVAEAVTFAIPHDKLGEEVGAAVVLAEGQEASEADLRAFVSEQVAAFKVPRRILFVTELPKGSTGKVQRIGMAAKLGL
ncbi:MAG TPA: AMP-dependent synthetase, partial [Ilumatobacteraceae bacterium]